jgi:hypothetical protein
MNICIFTGPTLSPEEGRAELEAIYLPPVAQGDVFRLACHGPKAIGLIDGYFAHVAAVWHKEILWAMAQGIHVYGSASMGALRAAELASFGMEGVGTVFEAFRDGTLEDDDEVAVAHGLADSGYRCLSDAMVNIRATLAKAEAEAVLAPATRTALVAIAKAIFYPARSYGLLLQRAAEEGLPPVELAALRAWLPEGAVNVKRQDAVAMLRLMRRHLSEDTPPKQVDYQMEHTDFWRQAMRSATNAHVVHGEEGRALPDAAILEELRLEGGVYLQARDQGLLRRLAVAEAQRFGNQADDEAIETHAARLRQRLGLQEPDDFGRWLHDNDLSPERFNAIARQETLLTKLLRAPDSNQYLLDSLRLTGRYAALAARALDKQQRLRSAKLEVPTLEEVGLTLDELMQWYFGGLGPLYPADPGWHARRFGFDSVNALAQAVLREYCYVRLNDEDTGAATS